MSSKIMRMLPCFHCGLYILLASIVGVVRVNVDKIWRDVVFVLFAESLKCSLELVNLRKMLVHNIVKCILYLVEVRM